MTAKQIIEVLRGELKPIVVEAVKPILDEALEPIQKTLEAHTRKIDALTSEMHEVHRLAETTVDIVEARYEKNHSSAGRLNFAL